MLQQTFWVLRSILPKLSSAKFLTSFIIFLSTDFKKSHLVLRNVVGSKWRDSDATNTSAGPLPVEDAPSLEAGGPAQHSKARRPGASCKQGLPRSGMARGLTVQSHLRPNYMQLAFFELSSVVSWSLDKINDGAIHYWQGKKFGHRVYKL